MSPKGDLKLSGTKQLPTWKQRTKKGGVKKKPEELAAFTYQHYIASFRKALYQCVSEKDIRDMAQRCISIAKTSEDEMISIRALDTIFYYLGIKPPEKMEVTNTSVITVNSDEDKVKAFENALGITIMMSNMSKVIDSTVIEPICQNNLTPAKLS